MEAGKYTKCIYTKIWVVGCILYLFLTFPLDLPLNTLKIRRAYQTNDCQVSLLAGSILDSEQLLYMLLNECTLIIFI